MLQSQVLGLIALICVALCGYEVAAGDFTPAESEAAREALVEVLDAAVAKAASQMAEQLDLPPSISDEVRRYAFIKVETVREVKNIKLDNVKTLRRRGTLGADPIAPAGGSATFTLPLALDTPHLTGDLVRKINSVGPTGHFNTTIGVFALEAEGVASVARDACSFNVTAVRATEVNGVDTTVEGAGVGLNSVLATDMSSAVRTGTLPFREHVSKAILEKLQEVAATQDCSTALKNKLKTAA